MQERFVERRLKFFLATRLGHKTIFGQYESYRSEEGVDSNSNTPTFVAGDIYIDNWRWKGVPFYFMTGKKMPYQCVEVVIKLKAPPVGLFEGETPGRIVMRIQPRLTLIFKLMLSLQEWVKRLSWLHYTSVSNWLGVDGYEKLFDALNGDQSHFVHSEEVLESWRIVDDLLYTGEKCPIRTVPYIHKGGWGPQHKVDFITDWDYPE